MTDNMQCPVCTLYLHAGINLSDHLETHPKEQVIRALVQLTISKVGDGDSLVETAALSDALNSDSINNGQLCTAKIEEESGSTIIKEEPQHAKNISSNESKTNGAEPTSDVDKSKQEKQSYQQNVGDAPTLNSTTSNAEFSNYVTKNRYQQSSPTATFNSPERNQSDVGGLLTSQHHHMSRSLLPPPPPPPPPSTTTTTTAAQSQLHHNTTAIPYNNIQQKQQQQQQQTHALLTQRQVSQTTATAQQSSNLKIIYSPTLPPPPPLQLFSYQAATHTPQHQKPPPAYVTAINQIRFQHHQNKHQLYNAQQQQQQQQTSNTSSTATTLPTTPTILDVASLVPTAVNQRQIRASSSTTPPITTKQMPLYNTSMPTISPATTTITTSTSTSSSSFTTMSITKTTAAANTTQQQKTQHLIQEQHNKQPQQQQQQTNNKNNLNTVSNVSFQQTTNNNNNNNNTELSTNKTLPAPPTNVTTFRQSNSPFSTLMAAAGSPSSSSVLRYAESPVAHYLERDNGDFIVQETPKHIVECVETDNGEFSVIERIYQSPPSVLHMHDEYDDEEDDDVNVDNNNDDNKITTEKKESEGAKECKEDDDEGDDDDDQEFLSIHTDSNDDEDDDEFTPNNKLNKSNNSNSDNITTKTTTTTVNTNHFNTNNTAINQKKSSKNSITVLSDVQLNLTEYLDLMGNIVASNKISPSKPFSANLLLPMVKVEKEEPIDEQYELIDKIDNNVKDLTTTTTKPPNKTISNYNSNNNNNNNNSNANNNKRNNNKNNYNKNKTDELVKSNSSRQHKKDNKIEHKDKDDPSSSSSSSNNNNNNTNDAEYKSSHVTSVIRMVTTSSPQQLTTSNKKRHQQQQNTYDIEHMAEDLTQVKTEDEKEVLPPPPPLKKGPKKLIIKPKSTKTEPIANFLTSSVDDEKPTTSAAAAAAKQQEIEVKDEPMSNSILEQHLTRGQKEEEQLQSQSQSQPQLQSQSLSPSPSSAMFKEEDNKPLIVAAEGNVADDARVLLEFAHSKKRLAVSSANFLSPTSIFSNPDGGRGLLRCENDFIPVEHETNAAVQDIVISSSYASSQEATDMGIHNTNVNTTEYPLGFPQQQTYDIPFSFVYGNGASNSHAAHQHSRAANFSPLYQQTNDAGTTAATLASGSNSLATTLEDSSSTHASRQQHAHQWYHPHVINAANVDFETALAVDCNNTDVMGSKYLDLDTCKRESTSLIGSGQPAPSSTSTSSSFAAVTESSLPSGCTADALNIRTDEKMPAKGEISEQESNCDIENSWSQPMFGDYPGRFFKSSFPGIFQAENCWMNQDEYFTIHDLTTPNTANNNNNNNNNNNKNNSNNSNNNSARLQKSFDFRLPLEATTSAAANSSNNNNNNINIQLFSQLNNSNNNNNNNNNQHNIDNFPTTSIVNNLKSTSSKKKRKRPTQQPTATITSQQLLIQQQQINNIPIHAYQIPTQQQQNQQQQQQQQQEQQINNLIDPENLFAGPSTTAAAAAATVNMQYQRPKPRKKIYQCAHCSMQYTKLKDRNSHMILQHNYVRRNRRLILAQHLNSESVEIAATSLSNVNATATSSQTFLQDASATVGVTDYVEDSKQGIVKIEMTEMQIGHDTSVHISANATTHITTTIQQDNTEPLLNAKSEFVDDKTLVPVNAAGGNLEDNKLNITTRGVLPLATTTPATKLATLYRMLVSYNMEILRRNQNFSEIEEKLIKSSIFFCYVCRCNFTSVKLYDAHLTEHPAECFTCGKKFQRWKNFSLHLKRHLGWKEFGCNVCEKKFVVRSALVEHMRMHTGHTPLKCKICGKNFKRYSNLTQHRKRHVRQIVRKKEYVCYCGEVLPSKARFLWHKETHDAKPKCCPYCCDRFVHANSLRRHIRLAHSDKFDYTEPMECPMCKQIFAKSSIKAHMATHSMDTQYNCAICSKSFSTKWNLKIHSWVHANRTAKPFKCEHCPKAFVREIDFKNHMNAHKQIKPYTCEYCGCKFIRKYNYMRHRREHHGNKKYTCDLCKKSFHRHYYLIEHRRIHTGERPFTCTICGKSSTTKTNHNKHLKIHHSRDPFTVEA